MSKGSTVTPALVREIIATSMPDDELEGAISSAMVLYVNYLSGCNIPYDMGTEIKRYLAAHFVALRDPTTRISSEKIGDAAVSYSEINVADEHRGLATTAWGQTAIDFDPTGTLYNIGKTPPRWFSL